MGEDWNDPHSLLLSLPPLLRDGDEGDDNGLEKDLVIDVDVVVVDVVVDDVDNVVVDDDDEDDNVVDDDEKGMHCIHS